MASEEFVIAIHPQAPIKPPRGGACNGCGICCLAQPCPLGILLSRRRTGACVAVVWSDAALRYQCGAARGPLAFLVRRWIAVGQGCDCSLHDTRMVDDNNAP